LEDRKELSAWTRLKNRSSEEVERMEEKFKRLGFSRSERIDALNRICRVLRVHATIYFDFETTTDGERHLPYVVCAANADWKDQNRTIHFTGHGDNVVTQFMEWALDEAEAKHTPLDIEEENPLTLRLVAHSAAYELGMMAHLMCKLKLVENGSHMFGGQMTYISERRSEKGKARAVRVLLTDSLKYVPEKLAKFPKMFNLGDVVKEVMPHSLVDRKLVARGGWVSRDALIKAVVDESDRARMFANFEKWGLRDGDHFNLLEYSRKYCELDVVILRRGIQVFRDFIKKICDLDVIEFLTIASLSDRFMMDRGCSNGVWEVTGHLRDFIKLATVGGRVMSSFNEKMDIDPFHGVDEPSLKAEVCEALRNIKREVGPLSEELADPVPPVVLDRKWTDFVGTTFEASEPGTFQRIEHGDEVYMESGMSSLWEYFGEYHNLPPELPPWTSRAAGEDMVVDGYKCRKIEMPELIERFHNEAMSSVEASVSKAAVVVKRFADWAAQNKVLISEPAEVLDHVVYLKQIEATSSHERTLKKLTGVIDANSLYPSAIAEQADEVNWVLRGPPQLLQPNQLSRATLRGFAGYFVRARVTKMVRGHAIAIARLVREERCLWTNDLVGQELHLDRFTLEDLETFCGAEFEILQGIYFTGERNPAFGKVMRELYEERMLLKAAKNPLEKVIKLILNASYGKAGERAHDVKTIHTDSLKKLVTTHWHVLIRATPIYDSWGAIAMYKG
jgi:hypothetical protein